MFNFILVEEGRPPDESKKIKAPTQPPPVGAEVHMRSKSRGFYKARITRHEFMFNLVNGGGSSQILTVYYTEKEA